VALIASVGTDRVDRTDHYLRAIPVYRIAQDSNQNHPTEIRGKMHHGWT
jgi:hypothetical protein